MRISLGLLSSMIMLTTATFTHGAGMDGANVNFGVYTPTSTSLISEQVDTIVGPGIELHDIQNLALPGTRVANADIDFSATQVSFSFLENITIGSGPFNGYVMNFSGPEVPLITGVSLNPSTTIDNSIALSFDSDSVFISLPGVPLTASSLLVVDLQVTPVPEPETYAMLLSGLGLLGLMLRRKKILFS